MIRATQTTQSSIGPYITTKGAEERKMKGFDFIVPTILVTLLVAVLLGPFYFETGDKIFIALLSGLMAIGGAVSGNWLTAKSNKEILEQQNQLHKFEMSQREKTNIYQELLAYIRITHHNLRKIRSSPTVNAFRMRNRVYQEFMEDPENQRKLALANLIGSVEISQILKMALDRLNRLTVQEEQVIANVNEETLDEVRILISRKLDNFTRELQEIALAMRRDLCLSTNQNDEENV